MREREVRALRVGDPVRWASDGASGTVVAILTHGVTIHWRGEYDEADASIDFRDGDLLRYPMLEGGALEARSRNV